MDAQAGAQDKWPIEVTGPGASKPGSDVTLEARLTRTEPSIHVSSWRWQRESTSGQWNDILGETNSELILHELELGSVGSYRAIATANTVEPATGQPVNFTSHPFEVTMSRPPSKADPKPDPELTEQPPLWVRRFAIQGGVVATVLLAAFVWLAGVLQADLGLDGAAYGRLPAAGVLAGRLAGPLVALGGALLAIGVWMVAVEWRGRFASSKADLEGRKGGLSLDPTTLIAAIGKLKGPSLVMVAGLVLVLSAAWIGSAAVQPPHDPDASVTSSASPTPPGPGSTETTNGSQEPG